MVLKYIAHSCFQLKLDSAKQVLFDPFAEKVGYDMAGTKADIVLMSHSHYDHGCTEKVIGDYELFSEPGEYENDGILIRGFTTMHDKEKGTKRGTNIAFKLYANGLSILHCGDLGHLLDMATLKSIGPVDVLLVPVGGYSTIDAVEAYKLCISIGADVIIPMHYWTPSCTLPIEKVAAFVDKAYLKYDCFFLDVSEMDIARLTPGVYIMKNSFGE